MARGDHLVVGRGVYSHHGIDLGNGQVIHYIGGTGGKSSKAVVKKESRQKFADGGQVRLGSSKAKYSPSEIVRRAKSRLGEGEYDLFANNCEQFVNWCRTGEDKSQQVETAETALVVLSPATGIALKTYRYLKKRVGVNS